MNPRRLSAGALLLALLVLQLFLQSGELSPFLLLLTVVVLAELAFALRWSTAPDTAGIAVDAPAPTHRARPLTSWLLGIEAVGVVGVVLRLMSRPLGAEAWDVAVAWVGLMILFPFAAGLPVVVPTRTGLRALIRSPEVWVVAGLMVAGGALRVVGLETLPHHVGSEEGEFGFIAMATREGEPANPFVTGWFTHPVLPFFLQGALMAVFGDTVLGVRMFSAIGGIAGVLATYLWVQVAFGPRLALMAAALLAGYHAHLYFSRTALQVGQSWLSAFLPLTLFFIHVGVTRGRTWAFALAGLTSGVAQYFYFAGRIIPLIAIVVLLGTWWTQRSRGHPVGRWLGVYMAGVLIGMLPLAVHYVRAPETYLDRVQTVLSDTPDTASAVAESRGEPLAAVLPGHVMQTVLAYHHFAPQEPFYLTGRPLLDPLSAALVLVGITVGLRRWRDPRYLTPLIAAFLILAAVAPTELPPQPQRLFINSPIVMLLVALGLTESVRLTIGPVAIGPIKEWSSALAWAAALTGLIVGLSIWLLFGDYLPSGRDGEGNAEVAAELGYYLREEDRPVAYYFFAEPRMSTRTHFNIAFLARQARGTDVPPAPASPSQFRIGPRRTLFVFLPERLNELTPLRTRFPGPDPVLHRSAQDAPLFWVYRPSASP